MGTISEREKELKAFDDTKAGVKGLVDSTGLVKIPGIFVRPADELAEELNFQKTQSQLPIIDLKNGRSRREIVDDLRYASEKWGFFQLVNHGIPLNLLDKTIDGVRGFHEQDVEVKKGYYSRDRTKKVIFSTGNERFTSPMNAWRDTLTINLRTYDHLEPNELPVLHREAVFEYIKCVRKLGNTILELLSEALGLQSGHLEALEGAKGCTIAGHYYPACPEPELTMGGVKHADVSFITILLQDQLGGLQVLYENSWIDVPPIPESFVVNIGDILQVLSNDKFKSVQHRVLANRIGPRISVASFILGSITKLLGPIEELISDENPPVYKDFLLSEYLSTFNSKVLPKPRLDYFKR